MEMLKKEKEFHKMNEELEEKTKALLREAQNVKKFQENLLRNDCSASINPLLKSKTSLSSLPLENQEENIQLSVHECKELNVPEDVNNIGIRGFVHFLKAKTKKMQFDYDKLTCNFKIKSDECHKLQSENKKLSEEREKWLQNLNVHKNIESKLENQLSVVRNNLQGKDNEIMALKRSIDLLEKEAKTSKLTQLRTEQKLNKLSEECERLKNDLKVAKQNDKEVHEEQQKKVADLNNCIDKLEKQKLHILNGFKKQLLFIDNLKRQKVHLQSIRLLDGTETDLLTLLNLKTEKQNSFK